MNSTNAESLKHGLETCVRSSFLSTEAFPWHGHKISFLVVKVVKATEAPNCPDICHAPTCQPDKTHPTSSPHHALRTKAGVSALASMCRWIPTLLKACCNTCRHRTVLDRSSGWPFCLVVRDALMLVPGLGCAYARSTSAAGSAFRGDGPSSSLASWKRPWLKALTASQHSGGGSCSLRALNGVRTPGWHASMI